MSAVALAGACAAVRAADPNPLDGLDRGLLDELRRVGLIGVPSEPVRAFSWTTVTTRPLRAARNRHEVFAGTPVGAPAGLSPMVREERMPDGAVRRIVRGVSVRGLMLLRPGDDELEVRAQGLSMPLREGQRFDLVYDDDEGGALKQRCTVRATVAASAVHAAIPGEALRIECGGRGSYYGIGVRVSAIVMYLKTPGVFVVTEQAIESPIGRLPAGTRVVDFAMGAR